jgi:hypothetical protein
MSDPDELRDLLLDYLDRDVAPVTAAEARRWQPATQTARAGAGRRRRLLVASLTVAFCAGVALVAIVLQGRQPARGGPLLPAGTPRTFDIMAAGEDPRDCYDVTLAPPCATDAVACCRTPPRRVAACRRRSVRTCA